jgi:hypothetical protein
MTKSGGLMEWDYLGLVAEIEARRACGMGSLLPEDLSNAYHEAIGSIPRLVADVQPKAASETAIAALAGALAISFGKPRLGMAIMELGWELNLGHGKIACPASGEQYYVPRFMLNET